MIESIVIEQLDKVLGECCGGYKYGADYNRVQMIMERHKDKTLVRDIMETIEDESLKDKVKVWMAI